ncbi:phage holin family protein [Ilyomonas limi]|uniref:Phage holin family protein n=1 Tax=Ilyomonas limi TaxID=2575867 RepID=A0A4U3L9C8_9BACT|nr:phage holin family protein [Ilyomonas limi]TKK70307.1 phage holin family protein [Ilyomonas limi]
MRFIGKILVTAMAALIASYLLPGVTIHSGITAIIIALVLALLNTFIKPILIILTIPVTVFTFGLFLLVINTIIIKWTAFLVGPGFTVENWWAAFWFSILLSIVTYIIEVLIGDKTRERRR